MSFGEYTFLPWLRRGIANQLQQPAAAASRAALSVAVRVRSDIAAVDVPPKSVLLVGPGDLIGVNAQMVIRTEPRAGIANFEPNYLAYVDFYDEDFAWRYTPDVPDKVKHRLTPWITLLVLKDDEFKPLPARPLPAIELTAAADLAAILPPVNQLWAWAHVHLNASLGTDGAPNLDLLGTLLRRNPDLGYCRLVSPRRLEPKMAYHAFVVPTFEVGRLAGLGDPVPDATPGLEIAWTTARTLPVYFEWGFSTGAAGDFEDLVRALVPRDVDERVGIREMDVQQPGFHLPPASGQKNNVVGLEGVLLAPTTEHVPITPGCDLPANLAIEVNLPADAQQSGVPAADDPLISAPLYGRWHALVDRVKAFPEHQNWINELNTDPRFRAVAGMGTKVIQDNQESYMKLAWDQIGDIVSLNRRISFLQLSMKSSDALYQKNLVPLATEQTLAITANVMRKVLGSPVTVHRLVQQSRLPRAALSGAMRKQLRPRGPLSRRAFGSAAAHPLREMIAGLNDGRLTAAPPLPAPVGTTYERSLKAAAPPRPAWLEWIATHRLLLVVLVLVLLGVAAAVAQTGAGLIVGSAVAAAAAVAYQRLGGVASRIEMVRALQPDALTPDAIAALPPNDAFTLPTSGAPAMRLSPTGGPDSLEGMAFRRAALEFSAGLVDRPASLAAREPLALGRVHATMMQALRPAPAFVARHSAMLKVADEPFSHYIAGYHDARPNPPDPRIVPVMAYPDIKLPMYKPLKKLQRDNFVPNLDLVPPDTISIMLTNPPVIESYMVGLNHEFARELLWREYPTDQRPSTFRQFWDASHYVDTENLSEKALAEKIRDIKRLHEWGGDTLLGTHNNRLAADGKPRVVLIIRGELLKRYPNTIIYAQKAQWGKPPEHQGHLTLYDETGEKADPDTPDPNFRFPMFRAEVEPDIYFVGFDLLLDEVRGDPTLEETADARARIDPNRLGWFFVLQEVVGEPRFGLDEHAVTSSEDPLKWDSLSWENLGPAVSVIDFAKPFASQPPKNDTGGAAWGSHAADTAFILYQKPALVGVHARDMLKNVKMPYRGIEVEHMTNVRELYRTAEAARSTRDAARADLRTSALQLYAVEQELARVRRSGAHGRARGVDAASLEREQAALHEAVGAAARNLAGLRESAAAAIRPLLVDPQQIVSQLDDATPFVLFPVRIETKFSSAQDNGVLRVRIFPDDIAIAHHEKTLTVGEKQAGETYWRARARANGAATPADKDTAQRGAWNLVAERYGAYRASWITRSTQPDSWDDNVKDPGALDFPDVETKPLAWSEAPRSPVMPDIFAIVLEHGKNSRTVLSRIVPDDLPLGPDPMQAEGVLTRDPVTNRLKISDDLRWLIDFDLAESVGMGVRIPLTRDEMANGFDRILVIGLRLSTDRAGSGGLLARLIESHRYSRGFSIVPQGAPTNNTDEAASGLTTVSESVDETYALEHDPTPFPLATEPMRQLDGERLAHALGVPIDVVRAVPSARRADIGESVAMNRALWSGTLGQFVKEMLDGTFSNADSARVQRFLTEFVHSRGSVPAIRVGPQPYGVVITSAFDDWAWSDFERGDEGDFWDRLQTQLGLLRSHWQSMVDESVPFVGKRDSKGNLLDPFETLVAIVGLQASSVEYWSRTGVPDSYLKALASYQGNDPDLVNNWIGNAKNNRILELTMAHLPFSDKARLHGVLFLDRPDRVTSPVVDGDPAVPLSETRTIRPYDTAAARNYIHWLATASTTDIQGERFAGADGALVQPPDALLYKLLRVAALAEVNTSSRLLVERVRADIFAAAPDAVGDMPNVRERTLMPGHYAMVDTAKVGLTAASMTTGDYLLNHARAATAVLEKPPEAAGLAALTSALKLLADLPTARLERLFAEHVDVVSHRLDAWLTGLFARRLAIERSRRRHGDGTYLGAYGWVLNVRPATDRQVVPPAQIPHELTPAVEGPVVTYANNGGFVHAPALPHAVTAAVLRNAYLTHAEPKVADRMAVNLSSARVRTALNYIDGLQNGQELDALLGYQLERGLHEGHPGIELDSFVYVLRERFPLISKKLTPTPDGTAAEVVEARNVVNGYDLIDFAKGKTYPYDIDGLPNALGAGAEPAQARAIAKEVDRLRDALDAVADLLLAESVHQVVQGNYARARGSVQALSDGERPPLPDVVQTPRMGKSLTHRVALLLDPAATAGWHTVLTPRAAANAALNHWLTTVLPQPADIQWTMTLGAAALEFVNVTTLAIEPIDLVLMSGERTGDLASKLEQLIVRDFRAARAVGDGVATFAFAKTDPAVPLAKALVYDPDRAQPGKHSLGSLLPLLKAVRRLITARPLGARDLMRPTEAQHAHPENPNGYDGAAPPLKDLAELKARLEGAHADLDSQRTLLKPIVAAMTPLADALAQNPALPIQPTWSVLLPQVRAGLRTIVLFGIPEALPPDAITITRPLIAAEAAQAAAVLGIVDQKLARARKLLDIAFPAALPPDPADAARGRGARVTARLDAYTEAAHLLLGADFVIVPLFGPHSEGVAELASATAAPIETDGLAIESWLQSLAHVRPAMAAWDMLATYHEWLSDALLTIVPVQLPLAPGARWIGGIFGDTVRADDVVSIAIHQPPASYASPLAGLLLDEWTELVPSADETTGIAMHINRPNAVAPQALLVAVAPKQTGAWAWSDLIAILHDTMDRAQLRALEPDRIKFPYFQLLPPIVTAFNYKLLIPAAKFVSSRAATERRA